MTGFNIQAIDDVIHGRLRLGIVAYLVGAGTADFAALKAHLEATDGNLSVHLRKLEEAVYVTISKIFRGRKPLTEGSLTDAGRQAFMRYREAMSGLVARK